MRGILWAKLMERSEMLRSIDPSINLSLSAQNACRSLN
jgi:hypothetical protein